MPTTISFKKLLGGSPFPPMKAHMKLATEATEHIPLMLQAIFDHDEQTLKKLRYKVFDLETEADQIYDKLSSKLSQSKFLPVHRHDLISVLQQQEMISDTAQDIAGLLSVNLDVALEMREPLLELANNSVEAVRMALAVIKTLDALVETGFKGPDVDTVNELIDQLAETEDGTDMQGIDLMDFLHMHHKDKDAVSTVFTYQLIRWLSELADYAELIGSHMRLVVSAK